jgi:hypothetical protein
MEDEFINKNPRYVVEDIFVRLEEKFTDISRKMALIMAALVNMFGPFGEVGGSNLEVGSDEKLGDIEDLGKESKKEPKKKNPSSNTITSS